MLQKIKESLKGKFVSIAFDGTCRFAHLVGFVLRYVGDDHQPVQLCVRISMLAKAYTAEELAYELNQVLRDLEVDPTHLIGVMRDRASTNTLAVKMLRPFYRHFVDMPCCSHFLDLFGGKLLVSEANSFISNVINVFNRSDKARLMLRDQTEPPLVLPKVNNTRWFAEWELAALVARNYPSVTKFLLDPDNKRALQSQNFDRARDAVYDAGNERMVKIGLAVMLDVMEPIVKACYNIESDGPTIFLAYDILSIVRQHLDHPSWPSLYRIGMQQAYVPNHGAPAGQPVVLAEDYAKAAIAPLREYFHRHVLQAPLAPAAQGPRQGDYHHVYEMARVARWLNPRHMSARPGRDIDDIDVIALQNAFPPGFITDAERGSLLAEMHLYAHVLNTFPEVPDDRKIRNSLRHSGICQWWHDRSQELQTYAIPTWCALFSKILVLQVNSAGVERLFSMFKTAVEANQANMLQDLVEFTTAVRYNTRRD